MIFNSDDDMISMASMMSLGQSGGASQADDDVAAMSDFDGFDTTSSFASFTAQMSALGK